MASAMTFHEALAKVLAEQGTGGDPAERFQTKVAEFAKRDGCPEHEAFRKVRSEHSALFDALQASRVAPVNEADPRPTAAKQLPELQAFTAKVGAIALRDGCAGHIAMSRARREHPELFAALT